MFFERKTLDPKGAYFHNQNVCFDSFLNQDYEELIGEREGEGEGEGEREKIDRERGRET